MPNHFLIVGLCGRDFDCLDADGKNSVDFQPLLDANLCELVNKLPEELEGIVATNPKCRYRNKTTGEWSKDCNGPVGDDECNWERVLMTDKDVSELEAKYGASDWYEWQLKHWGTKWGTYGTKTHELGGDESPILIEFQTAWNPPTAEMMRKIDDYLCKTYFLKNIRWIGHEPYDNTTVDIDISTTQRRRHVDFDTQRGREGSDLERRR